MKKISGIIILLFVTASCLWAGKAAAQNYQDTAYSTDTTASIEYTGDQGIQPPVESGEANARSTMEIAPVFRRIPGDSLLALKNDQDFYYMAYLDSLLKASQQAKPKQPPAPPEPQDNSNSFWAIPFVKYMFWIIAFGVVGYVLFKLFKGDGGMFVGNKAAGIPEVETEQEIPENDLEGLLQRAIKNGNYRLATRYQFLKTLNRLGEKGILSLSTEKTNYQYATELQGRPYANNFTRLSLQYEYVWFGEFDLTQQQFASVQAQHQQFLKEI